MSARSEITVVLAVATLAVAGAISTAASLQQDAVESTKELLNVWLPLSRCAEDYRAGLAELQLFETMLVQNKLPRAGAESQIRELVRIVDDAAVTCHRLASSHSADIQSLEAAVNWQWDRRLKKQDWLLRSYDPIDDGDRVSSLSAEIAADYSQMAESLGRLMDGAAQGSTAAESNAAQKLRRSEFFARATVAASAMVFLALACHLYRIWSRIRSGRRTSALDLMK